MASFTKGGAVKTPFGKNTYLRSTVGCKFESYSLAASTVPVVTIDGVAGQKSIQAGTVLAKIASGPDLGKVGPYQAAGTAEVQTITVTGAPTGGTYTLTYAGQATAALPWNATAAQVQAALEALSNIGVGDILVAGGPHPATAITVTFMGILTGDVVQMTATASLTGGTTPNVAVTTTTAGVAGAADGRGDKANIVGILDTFLPWQLMERDVEVGVLTEGTVVQAWCFEYNAAGSPVALTNTTTDLLVGAAGTEPVFRSKRLDIKFA